MDDGSMDVIFMAWSFSWLGLVGSKKTMENT